MSGGSASFPSVNIRTECVGHIFRKHTTALPLAGGDAEDVVFIDFHQRCCYCCCRHWPFFIGTEAPVALLLGCCFKSGAYVCLSSPVGRKFHRKRPRCFFLLSCTIMSPRQTELPLTMGNLTRLHFLLAFPLTFKGFALRL